MQKYARQNVGSCGSKAYGRLVNLNLYRHCPHSTTERRFIKENTKNISPKSEFLKCKSPDSKNEKTSKTPGFFEVRILSEPLYIDMSVELYNSLEGSPTIFDKGCNFHPDCILTPTVSSFGPSTFPGNY